ncbi:DoxX family protein [Methylosinus sp. H3A]|uniref:DoxX family protein n=1 Tax=Methylosinus sp. H3A TaxID=2785786 RepID=UPI0018C31927|nr:DoxX family protein [Methylosinus sp. H3A]MBG0810933.1 DoxX family protein [Methylosinus sp. H3A]
MTSADTAATRNWMRWTGYGLTGLVSLFMTMDAAMKLTQLPIVLETTAQLGWPVTTVVSLGLVLLISTALYVIPSTSLLGAILLTGYLGGAVATHARVESPLFSHTLFGVYVGIMLWGALYLRSDRLRSLIPIGR